MIAAATLIILWAGQALKAAPPEGGPFDLECQINDTSKNYGPRPAHAVWSDTDAGYATNLAGHRFVIQPTTQPVPPASAYDALTATVDGSESLATYTPSDGSTLDGSELSGSGYTIDINHVDYGVTGHPGRFCTALMEGYSIAGLLYWTCHMVAVVWIELSREFQRTIES